jgi:hypothetical protein
MGRIQEFVRRDEKSPLFAKIRPLVPTGPVTTTSTAAAAAAWRHKELRGDPSVEVVMVEATRLCGKLVLLRREDFVSVAYAAEDEGVYCAAPAWLAEHPCVLEEGEEGGVGSGSSSGGGGVMRQRSQDY